MSTLLKDQDVDISNISPLYKLLSEYRSAARTEREKGTYFERLAIAYLTSDPVQVEQYDDVRPYSVRASEYGWHVRDTGIDLVARLRNEDGYAAIQ